MTEATIARVLLILSFIAIFIMILGIIILGVKMALYVQDEFDNYVETSFDKFDKNETKSAE